MCVRAMYYSAGFVVLMCLCSLLFLLPNYSAIFSYLVLVMTWSSQRSHLKWSPFTKHQVAFGDSVFQATQLELTGNPLHKRQHLENVLREKKRANMASQCFNGADFLRNIHDRHRYPNLYWSAHYSLYSCFLSSACLSLDRHTSLGVEKTTTSSILWLLCQRFLPMHK